MSEKTGISWTDSTHNFWYGCTKISDGCRNCCAERDMTRFNKDFSTLTKAVGFDKPLHWKRGRKIFINSWSDFFIDGAEEWRKEAWKIIKATPQHTYLILTKRADKLLTDLPDDWGDGYPNVWIGISAENQKMFDYRMFELSKIKASVKFVSIEPMIGDIYIKDEQFKHIDMVIVGGESGNFMGKWKFRPCNLEWFHSLIIQCKYAQTAIFIKQLGTHLAKEYKLKSKHGSNIDEIVKVLGGNKKELQQFPIV